MYSGRSASLNHLELQSGRLFGPTVLRRGFPDQQTPCVEVNFTRRSNLSTTRSSTQLANN